MGVRCSNCGRDLDDQANFCSGCGHAAKPPEVTEADLKRQAQLICDALAQVAQSTRGKDRTGWSGVDDRSKPWNRTVVHRYSYDYGTSAALVSYSLSHQEERPGFWVVSVRAFGEAKRNQLDLIPELGPRRPSIETAIRQVFRHDKNISFWFESAERTLGRSGWILQN